MQRGALIQHDPRLWVADCLVNVELDYIDPRSLDGPQCVDLMLAGGYDFVLPCLSLRSYLAFRLAEVAHAANLETRVITYAPSPAPSMLAVFDGVLSTPLSSCDTRTFAEMIARPVRRHRTREDLDCALAEALAMADLVRVGARTERQPVTTLSAYRDCHPCLPWRALVELAAIHARPSCRRQLRRRSPRPSRTMISIRNSRGARRRRVYAQACDWTVR